jgi:dTDP-4-dehydrorhamnose reductase
MRVLVLGVTGMLGNAMLSILAAREDMEVYGTARRAGAHNHFPRIPPVRIIEFIDVENTDSLMKVFATAKPSLVVNCIGIVKQLAEAKNPLHALPLNSMLPHRLANLCQITGARLVHISTDCVFSGAKGNYLETDFADADDLYGRSKLLGEVDYPHAVTLRTSIIGHEMSGQRSLLNWFLAQKGTVKGFTKAIFSGLPTIELARVVRDYVAPRPGLQGIYHVASKPINKYDLLSLIAKVYGKDIDIIPDTDFVIDRSLNADKFRLAAGYTAPDWPDLIAAMFASFQAQRG